MNYNNYFIIIKYLYPHLTPIPIPCPMDGGVFYYLCFSGIEPNISGVHSCKTSLSLVDGG